MEIDVHCKSGLCPICEKKGLSDTFSISDRYLHITFECDNGCYRFHNIEIDEDAERIHKTAYVFSRTFNPGLGESNEDFYDNIKKEIKYWKENYRYIAEILERR